MHRHLYHSGNSTHRACEYSVCGKWPERSTCAAAKTTVVTADRAATSSPCGRVCSAHTPRACKNCVYCSNSRNGPMSTVVGSSAYARKVSGDGSFVSALDFACGDIAGAPSLPSCCERPPRLSKSESEGSLA